MLAPSFANPGGVAVFCESLMKNIGPDFRVEHFPVGSRPGKKIPYGRFLFFSQDVFSLMRTMHRRSYDLVHLNPSLETLSILRDTFYLVLVTSCFHANCLLMFHGWNDRIAQMIIRYRFLRWLFRTTYKKANVILVLCTDFKEQLKKIGVNAQRVLVITTMYDKSSLAELRYIPEGDEIRILFMARLVKSKGVYIAAEVGRLLAESGKKNFRLTFAGDGPEYSGLNNYIKSNQLEHNLRLVGYISGERKREVLLGNHIFLYPSYYGEGCPIVVLEGMGAGLAIVASSKAAIPEIVKDKENGFIIDSTNPTGYYEAVVRLMEDNSLLENMRQANRIKAEKNFEASVVTKKVEAIYLSIIERADPVVR